jgi:cytidylate kinase
LKDLPQKRVVVAIDGPAGAGKSTIAKRVAARLGFTYIDSGAMYRAVALWALRQKVEPADMHRMEQLAMAAEIELLPGRIRLNGEDVTDAIRTPEVSGGASKVAVIPGVRRALVAKQRAMGERSSVVMEGRDIGTVVFPDAQVKIYLDADPRERVRRRLDEVRAAGEEIPESALAAQMKERDQKHWRGGAISLELDIVVGLLLQNAINVAFAVQDANDPHRLPLHDVENEEPAELFHRPDPQALQGRVTEIPWRSHMGHAQ